MPVVSASAYRAPKPIDPNAEPSLYGQGRIEPDNYNDGTLSAVLNQQILSVNGTQFTTENAGDNYYYFLAPLKYGKVTFKANGLAGGWDGAHWPLDDIGDEYGPVVVTYLGKKYNLYRTDFNGNSATTYEVLFANG